MSSPIYLTNISQPSGAVIGRKEQLNTIRQLLAADTSIVLVNGLGGIGKTTIALEFIRQFGEDYKYLAWIEVTDTIAASFVSNNTLLEKLDLKAKLATLLPKHYEAQAFDLIINALNALDHCLLVIDNANDLDDLLQCQHKLRSLRATTLLTSRALPEEWTTVQIEELSPRYAAILFITHYGDVPPEKINLLKQLLFLLDHHTLLIELIAKAARKSYFSLETLYEKVQQNYLHDDDLNARKVATGIHADHAKLPQQERVKNYITMVFQQISTLNDTGKRYLRYMTLLPSNEYAESFLEEVFQITADTKNEYLDTLEALAQKGWLTQKRDEQGCTYKLHSLVQDVAIRELKLPYKEIEFFIKYLKDQVYIDTETKDYFVKFSWIPFADHLLEIITDRQYASYADLQHWLAWLIYQTGDFKKAKTLLGSAKDISERVLDDNHPDIGRNYSTLGVICRDLGEHNLALLYLEKAVSNAMLNYDKQNLEVAIHQSNLATVYRTFGKYEQARDLLEHVLTINIANFHKNHPAISLAQLNLGSVYQDLGQYDRARELLEKSLASDTINFGDSHPNVARSQANLAAVYQKLGRYEQARDLLEQALVSNVANFGERHANVAVCQSSLAIVYKNLGQYELARELLEKALVSDTENFGELHPTIATRYNNLAQVYIAQKDWRQAKNYFIKSLKICYAIWGEQHPNTQSCAKDLAYVQVQLGEQP